MSKFSLMRDADTNRIHLKGELSFKTVNTILNEAQDIFLAAKELDIDLAGVTRSDSAGLALLVEWMRIASATSRPISFRNVPAQMMAIAGTSGLDKLLPIK